MRVEVLLTGETTFTDNGNLTLATVVLAQSQGCNIIIDPGAWNQRKALKVALSHRGLDFSDIDYVIVTHLHWDHYINFELFANARLIVGANEWQRVLTGDLDYATPTTAKSAIEGWPAVTTVSSGFLVDDVYIIETPGHTHGHIAVRLMTSEGIVVVAGDALSHQSCVATGLPEIVNWSERDAAESIELILEGATQVIPGHGPSFEVHP